MDFAEPIRFEEAIAKLRERGVMPTTLDTAGLRALALAIRERSFFSARVESAGLLQKMRDYLMDFLEENRMENGGLRAQGRAEFVADMREFAIREGLGRVDPETGKIDPKIRESDLRDIRSRARLELIFDTQTEAAHEFGWWKQGNDPDILDVWPAQRFIRVRPVAAPRAHHKANEGAVKRKDDLKFWLDMNRDFGVPWGPWGFNSGMGVEDVDREEAEALGVIKKDEAVEMPEEKFNKGMEASARELDGDMGAALARATGGSVARGVARPRKRQKTEDLKTEEGRAGEKAPDKGGKLPRLPGTMEPVAVPPRKSPASAKLAGLDAHPDAATLRAALSVIDSVHDDGGLGEVLLRATEGTVNIGEYSYSGGDGRPKWIEISTRGPWPELTLLHEVGHWIDQQAFGGRHGFGTATGAWAEMAKLLTEGETAKEIRRRIRTGRSEPGGRKDISHWKLKELRESLKVEEMFARGYAQWIVGESGHPRMKEQLARADISRDGLYGMRGEDSGKFSRFIKDAFTKKGWL